MEGREQGVSTRDLAGGATAEKTPSATAAEDRERSEGASAGGDAAPARGGRTADEAGGPATSGTAVAGGDTAVEREGNGDRDASAGAGVTAERDTAPGDRTPEQRPGGGDGNGSTSGAMDPTGTSEGAMTTADMATQGAADSAELLPHDENTSFQRRWEEIQTGFVDEPRRAVEEADALVADLMQRLATMFADERKQLEGQWDRGDDVSTEDLRVALQRYRSFFDRLLSV